MISEELLSEVLKNNVTHIQESINENEICYMVNGETKGKFLNIYELAHKCKEWANKKYKACLISGYCKSSGYKCFTDNPYGLQYIKKIETQTADTEPEAIFKACEWILKENR